MQLSKSSFLFSWAKFGGINEYASATDTCHLLRAMLFMAPLYFLILTVCGVMVGGIFIGAPLLSLVVYITTGEFFDELCYPLVIALCVATIIGIGVGIGALVAYLKDRDAPKPKAFELASNAYRAFDEKYCHIVHLED